jgi:hypothetical protein
LNGCDVEPLREKLKTETRKTKSWRAADQGVRNKQAHKNQSHQGGVSDLSNGVSPPSYITGALCA